MRSSRERKQEAFKLTASVFSIVAGLLAWVWTGVNLVTGPHFVAGFVWLGFPIICAWLFTTYTYIEGDLYWEDLERTLEEKIAELKVRGEA